MGDPDGLDDVNRHLEEKDKEEEEEAEGAVRPEEEKHERMRFLHVKCKLTHLPPSFALSKRQQPST